MSLNDELGKRMKQYYEFIPKTKLMRRCPVAMRIDGKCFHSFAKGFEKPFDRVLVKTMQETMKYLCENIQGCVLGYTQSDEITLILIDYQTFDTDAWFDYEVQKMCSIASSMATMIFNKRFVNNMLDLCETNTIDIKMAKIYERAYEKGAMFDARCFNIPKEEVANLIYWRQIDASKNSIQMVGRAYFSHKELQHKSCNDIQDMLIIEKNINWNDFPTDCKRGSCCIKKQQVEIINDKEVVRNKWIIDTEIPIFKNEDRKYIEDLIYVGEE